MDKFINHTSSKALRFESIDLSGDLFYTVSTHLTYDLLITKNQKETQLIMSEKQDDFFYTDVLYTAPNENLVRFESDLSPFKPKLDVVINGVAYNPTRRPVKRFHAAICINKKLTEIIVTGSRYWKRKTFGWALSDPEYIEKLEISYDKAFGGHYHIDDNYFYSSFNPYGCGWYPDEYLRKFRGNQLPAHQIEFVDEVISSISQKQVPAGFGFFGKSWSGRIEYAGTWDEKWKQEKYPGLPDDFNFRYWCGAHPRLINDLPLVGKSVKIELFNFRSLENQSETELAITVPYECIFIANNYISDVTETKDCLLDTIVIDLPSNKVHVSYRIIFPKFKLLISTELFYLNKMDIEHFSQKFIEISNDKTNSSYILLPPSIRNSLTGELNG